MSLPNPPRLPHGRSGELGDHRSGEKLTGLFQPLMADATPDLNMTDGGTQCFPLKLYEQAAPADGAIFSQTKMQAHATPCEMASPMLA